MNIATVPDRWSPIFSLLRKFETYLAPDAPRLEIMHANDSRWSDEEFRRHRSEFSYGSQYGVYLLFDSQELRYVGVAMCAFDERIWSHDADVQRQWTDVIPFQHGWYFLAPALEFFLIAHLQPPANATYRKYTIGERVLLGPTKTLEPG